jgi:uncharacterized membrane protein YfcA
MQIIYFLILGLFAGSIGGLVGLGGGVIIVPTLIYLFGFSQQSAQGTSLAVLLPPVGLLAAVVYYQKGFVDLKAALFIGLGVFVGSLIGSKIALNLPTLILQRIFGALLISLGISMFFKK